MGVASKFSRATRTRSPLLEFLDPPLLTFDSRKFLIFAFTTAHYYYVLLPVRLPSVVSLQLYSSLDNEPTCLIEFACINQLGCGFTAGKRALLGNHSSTITV